MKHLMKKISALFISALLVVMTCVCGVTAFAANPTGTITVANAVASERYDFYRLLDVEYSTQGSGSTATENYKYTVPAKYDAFFATLNLTGYNTATDAVAKGQIVYNYLSAMQNDSDALKAFAAKAGSYIASNNVASEYNVNGATSGATKVENATYGYYLMVPSDPTTGQTLDTSAVFSLNTVTQNATIQNKSSHPTLTKKIIEGNNRVDSNMVAFGETYTYELTTAVPNVSGYVNASGEGYYEFMIEDALTIDSNINLDLTSFVVKIGNDTLTVNEDFVTEFYNPTTMSAEEKEELASYCGLYNELSKTKTVAAVGIINFNDASKNINFYDLAKQYEVGTPITVTFNAQLIRNEESIGTNGNPNYAALEFSANPREKGMTPVDEVKTYTAGLQVTKVDDEGNPLSGATFTFKSVAAQGFAEADISNIDITDLNASGTIGTYNATTKTWTFTTDGNGYVSFEGLDEGVYELVETVAPTGFSLPDNAKVTIKIDANTPAEVVFGQANLAKFTNSVTPASQNIVTNITNASNVTDADGATVAFRYVNHSQSILPATGMATLIGVSAAGIAGVGLSFVVGKKKKRENEK